MVKEALFYLQVENKIQNNQTKHAITRTRTRKNTSLRTLLIKKKLKIILSILLNIEIWFFLLADLKWNSVEIKKTKFS